MAHKTEPRKFVLLRSPALALLFCLGVLTAFSPAFSGECTGTIDLTSCDLSNDCWIEVGANDNDLPWLNGFTPDPLVKSRAFCSAENSTDGGVTGKWYSYAVYLPPDYDTWESTIDFPVVYSLHGSNGWGASYSGQAAETIDRRIRDRRAAPALYVFPYGGCDATIGSPPPWCDGWEQWINSTDTNGTVDMQVEDAIWELFAHVDANYSVTSAREGLGIEGYSSGGGKSLHMGLRTTARPLDIPSVSPYGDFPFGSVVGMSPGTAIAAAEVPTPILSCFENLQPGCGGDPTVTPRYDQYLNEYPNPEDGPVRLMLKYGMDDVVVTPENEVCWAGNGGLEFDLDDQVQGKCDALRDNLAGQWDYDSELVEPVCGQESDGGGFFETLCTVDNQPACPLGHDSDRMRTLRGDEVIAFHQQDYWMLPGLDQYELPCTEPTGDFSSYPGSSSPQYLVGDWTGNGCDTLAIYDTNKLYFDQSVDGLLPGVVDYVAFGDVSNVRANAIGRDVLIDTGLSAGCNPSETRVKVFDPRTETVLANSCLDMAPGDQLLVGDFGNINGVLQPSELDLGDFREDVGIRVLNDVHWFPQVAWGFSFDAGGVTTYGSGTPGQDSYSAGYWSGSETVAMDDFPFAGSQYRIDGETTPTGGLIWEADTEAIVRGADGGTLSVQLGGATVLTAKGGVPFDASSDRRVVTVSARINPDTSDWTGIGIADAASTSYTTSGQLWVRLNPGTSIVEVLADGSTVLASADLPGSGYRHVELRFDVQREVWSLAIDSTRIFSERGLPTGFIPTLSYAGFHIENSDKHKTRIDDFTVEATRLKQGALGVRRAQTGTKNNDLLLNYDLDGGHNLSYKFGTGDPALGGQEDEYLFGDWDGDGQTNAAVRRGCQLLLDAPRFDPNGELAGAAEHTFTIANCTP